MSKLIDYWKSVFIGKNENTPAFRRAFAKKLDKKQLKYVSERIGEEDCVIGHAGYILVKEDELVVTAEKGTLFRSKTEETSMNEFLSLEGVILTGRDLEHDGKERRVICYYTYYRKVEN